MKPIWKEPVWWFFVGMFVIFAVFLVWIIWFGATREAECHAAGGVYTRAGCLDPSVIRSVK